MSVPECDCGATCNYATEGQPCWGRIYKEEYATDVEDEEGLHHDWEWRHWCDGHGGVDGPSRRYRPESA